MAITLTGIGDYFRRNAQFKQRGGVITVLDGEAKAEFDTLMRERVIPQVEELIAPEVLEAAQECVKQ